MSTLGMYSAHVGAADPLTLLAATPTRIAAVVRDWDSRRWNSSYAPGKWTGAQIVLHLVHDEITWCARIRYALSMNDYTPQPYDGAVWIAQESPADPREALAAYEALRRLNLSFYRGLSPTQRRPTLRHPEFGEISVDWVLHTLAGHDVHHLKHLEAIAALA